MKNTTKIQVVLVSGVLLAGSGWGMLALADSHITDEMPSPIRALRTNLQETRDALPEIHLKVL